MFVRCFASLIIISLPYSALFSPCNSSSAIRLPSNQLRCNTAVLIKLKYCAIYVVFSGFSFSIVVYLVVLRMMWFGALHVREKKEIPALFFNGAGICRVVGFLVCFLGFFVQCVVL